jgi:hypothetical protein
VLDEEVSGEQGMVFGDSIEIAWDIHRLLLACYSFLWLTLNRFQIKR